MKHRLRLRVDAEPGALQRVLMVAARRGFEPLGFWATRSRDEFHIELAVESDRPAAMLAAMLNGLFSVQDVEVLS